MLKVINLKSPNSGRAVPNQFQIEFNNELYLKSYDSIIAKISLKTGEVSLDEKYWNYSNTTSKYRSQWLNETTAETKQKISKGTYKLKNLN